MSCNCQEKQQADQIKLRVKQKYDYLDDEEIDVIYDMAISDYLAIRYPSYNNRPAVEQLVLDFFVSQWVYKRMIDILGRAGGLNVVSYRENDLSIQYASGNIDDTLVREIMPKASVPK